MQQELNFPYLDEQTGDNAIVAFSQLFAPRKDELMVRPDCGRATAGRAGGRPWPVMGSGPAAQGGAWQAAVRQRMGQHGAWPEDPLHPPLAGRSAAAHGSARRLV